MEIVIGFGVTAIMGVCGVTIIMRALASCLLVPWKTRHIRVDEDGLWLTKADETRFLAWNRVTKVVSKRNDLMSRDAIFVFADGEIVRIPKGAARLRDLIAAARRDCPNSKGEDDTA